MEPPLLTARIAGRVVRYAVAGEQDAPHTLVLLHAFPLGLRMWAPQLGAAAAARGDRLTEGDWRVLAVGLAGFDGTDACQEPSMRAYARDVIALLDAMDVAAATICGLSMGGYVAFALLREAAARIERLVLADTRAGADGEPALAGRRRMLDLVGTGGAAAVAGDMLPKLLGRTSQLGRPDLSSRIRDLIGSQPAGAIADATRAMMARADALPLLGTIRVPALVVVGKEDTLTPPAEAERMHAAIPGSRLVQIPGAGHLSNMENPEAFNRAVREFLR